MELETESYEMIQDGVLIKEFDSLSELVKWHDETELFHFDLYRKQIKRFELNYRLEKGKILFAY